MHLAFSNGGPVTRTAFVYNGPKGMELALNPQYSGGSKTLGGSSPRTVREMGYVVIL